MPTRQHLEFVVRDSNVSFLVFLLNAMLKVFESNWWNKCGTLTVVEKYGTLQMYNCLSHIEWVKQIVKGVHPLICCRFKRSCWKSFVSCVTSSIVRPVADLADWNSPLTVKGIQKRRSRFWTMHVYSSYFVNFERSEVTKKNCQIQHGLTPIRISTALQMSAKVYFVSLQILGVQAHVSSPTYRNDVWGAFSQIREWNDAEKDEPASWKCGRQQSVKHNMWIVLKPLWVL